MASDEMTEKLNGTHVDEVNVDEIEDRDDNMMGCGGGPPPPFVELSSTSVSLESAAEACGNASLFLQNARTSLIKEHASKQSYGTVVPQYSFGVLL